MIRKLYNSIIEGRISKAEYEVAKLLQQTEYRNESFESVLRMVKCRNLKNA